VNKKSNTGLDILFHTYWSSKGWKNGSITKENFNDNLINDIRRFYKNN